jgi:hypothetical protein
MEAVLPPIQAQGLSIILVIIISIWYQNPLVTAAVEQNGQANHHPICLGSKKGNVGEEIGLCATQAIRIFAQSEEQEPAIQKKKEFGK